MNYKLCLLLLVCPILTLAQAVPDTLFDPLIPNPKYPAGVGPEIHIDAAHYNYHTLTGRFAPFARVLKKDGYKISENTNPFNTKNLEKIKLLVVSNAINETNQNNWSNPTLSAFTKTEIQFLSAWVEQGGRLLLIADHMPFGGAAKELATSFGFELCNCFAMDNRRREYDLFTKDALTIISNEITNGKNESHRVDSIITFTGTAFKIPANAIPILKLKNYTLLSPVQAWQFKNDTPHESCDEYYQAAALKFGKGKIILMGEAAMFTAQISGNQKVGMNSPAAKQNIQLLRNTIEWLVDD